MQLKQFITTGNRIAVENFVLGDLYTITFTNGTYINSACIGIGDNFVTFQRNEPELLFSLTMATAELVSSIELYAGGSGTNNYNDLTNKPQINDIELVGNKSLSDLGIQATISDIDTIRSGATAGATAVQPAALADYQPIITDLDTIRSGAAAGATAVQPAALAGYQTIIDSSHKLDADLVDDTTATHKFATAAQLSQIETNKNNISLQQDTVAQGGNGYAIINGIRLYVSSTTPTGSIPQGSTWINGNIIKAYGRTDNLFDMDSPNITDNTYINTSGQIISDNSYELSDYIPVSASTAYTWRFNLDSGSGHTASSVGLYNGDKELISGVSHAASARYFSFTTDANTAYVRCSVYKATADEAMLNLGNSPLPYVPYLDWQ